LTPELARQLHSQKVHILDSFRFEGWSIFHVDSHDADESLLFYSHDPLRSRYITRWSGAARIDEGPTIKEWTIENAPHIPEDMANCIAWYVTVGHTE